MSQALSSRLPLITTISNTLANVRRRARSPNLANNFTSLARHDSSLYTSHAAAPLWAVQSRDAQFKHIVEAKTWSLMQDRLKNGAIIQQKKRLSKPSDCSQVLKQLSHMMEEVMLDDPGGIVEDFERAIGVDQASFSDYFEALESEESLLYDWGPDIEEDQMLFDTFDKPPDYYHQAGLEFSNAQQLAFEALLEDDLDIENRHPGSTLISDEMLEWEDLSEKSVAGPRNVLSHEYTSLYRDDDEMLDDSFFTDENELLCSGLPNGLPGEIDPLLDEDDMLEWQ